MKKTVLRDTIFLAVFAASFVLLDLMLDRVLVGYNRLTWLHIALGAVVLLASYLLANRAFAAHRRAETVMRRAHDELEVRVHERTAELEQANAALRLEIVERNRMAQALQTSEQTARALMNALSESAFLLDTEGHILAANQTGARRLGASLEQVTGTLLFDHFPPDVAERRRGYLKAMLEAQQPLDFVDNRAGRTYDNHVHPVFDAEGKLVRLAVFGQDVTTRLEAEAALRASEAKYRLLFQNMTEGFALYELIYDGDGKPVDWRVLEVNDAYTHHTGLAREQIVGRRVRELFPAAIAEYLPRFAQVVETQTPFEFETYAKAVGRYQRVSTFPAGPGRFASIIEDITKRKLAEEHLQQAQAELMLETRERTALEERQRLARELHDSVSQALYGVSLGINTALVLLDSDRPKAREALNYALSLVHGGLWEMRTLIFELRPESLELEGLVAAVTKQVEAIRSRHGITVELSICCEPEVSLAIKEALYRVTQEALQNAIKHAQANRLEVSLTCERDILRLGVCDDGIGFDPAADYPGHLGLRSMRERAAQVGGTLEISSAPGQGTQVHASVPVPISTDLCP
jgi:PAS domain S-box-containing protein